MAIYHLSLKPVRRSTGRSAVAAAAYRVSESLKDNRTGLTHDFRPKGGVVARGIVVPPDFKSSGSASFWAFDRARLWNAAEAAERRKDAKTAQEIEVALPAELSHEQRQVLVEDLAQHLVAEYGCAADWAVHAPSREGDARNHHAHILITTRVVEEEGLGAKIALERENGWLRRQGLATGPEQVRALRGVWADLSNSALAQAGHDRWIDHRSHVDRNLGVRPTRSVGVHATALMRQGKVTDRVSLTADDRAWNFAALTDRAEDVLRLISDEKSVFYRRDITAAIRRSVGNDTTAIETITQAVLSSSALVSISANKTDTPDLYTTQRTVAMETEMVRIALKLHHGELKESVSKRDSISKLMAQEIDKHSLSTEQSVAVRHVTSAERIALVAGAAGSGKSTMLKAAHEVWRRSGHRVIGAALAGKAADGLAESSGIVSRTLSSWAYRWERSEDCLEKGDILVIDEVGMLSTAQLSSVLAEVERCGAKAVLVGDAEQLQAIGAGAAFRALTERCGVVSLTDIHRQQKETHRRASKFFAECQTAAGLDVYHREGALVWNDTREEVLWALAAKYTVDGADYPDSQQLALAYRRVDVQDLNLFIRECLKIAGQLPKEEMMVQTVHGERMFAVGDRMAFLANDSRCGVRNGSLGTVMAMNGGVLHVRLDGHDDTTVIDTSEFRAIDHGYAVTVHRSQGTTMDRIYAFGGETMDRHLTYVAMTRHREDVQLHVARETFADFDHLAQRLSRSGLQANALDYAGFLARRGLAGFLYRIGRGLKRGIGMMRRMTALPSLKETFLQFSQDKRNTLSGTTLTDGVTRHLRDRINVLEKEREQAREKRRVAALDKEQSQSRGMGLEL